MKSRLFLLIMTSLLLLNCATIKNTNGYTLRLKNTWSNDPNWRGYDVEVICNNEPAYAIFSLPGFNDYYFLSKVYVKVYGTDGERNINKAKLYYIVNYDNMANLEINLPKGLKEGTTVNNHFDLIYPVSIATEYFDRIVKQKTGYNSLKELNQKKNEMRLAEHNRLIEENNKNITEIDAKYGVEGIIRVKDIINGQLKIGSVYRIYDMVYIGDNFSNNAYSVNVRNYPLIDAFPFNPENQEIVIIGSGLLNASVRDTYTSDRFHRFLYGKVGYIVKYLGPREYLTKAGLVRVIQTFEYVGGNKFVEFKDMMGNFN